MELLTGWLDPAECSIRVTALLLTIINIDIHTRECIKLIRHIPVKQTDSSQGQQLQTLWG